MFQSSNRTNVALSRARHGMFVLGNGDALESGSGTWSIALDEFRRQEAYGPAFPFACYRHPDNVQWLSEPEEIDSLFPDGVFSIAWIRSNNESYRALSLTLRHQVEMWACLSFQGRRTCSSSTHPHILQCHPDDEFHSLVKCTEKCGKLCPLGHPCDKMCYEECACDFLVPTLKLSCGHVYKDVNW